MAVRRRLTRLLPSRTARLDKSLSALDRAIVATFWPNDGLGSTWIGIGKYHGSYLAGFPRSHLGTHDLSQMPRRDWDYYNNPSRKYCLRGLLRSYVCHLRTGMLAAPMDHQRLQWGPSLVSKLQGITGDRSSINSELDMPSHESAFCIYF